MMTTVDDAIAIGEARLPELASEVQRTGRPRILAGIGGADLILLPLAHYEELIEAVDIATGLLQGTADIAAGRVVSNVEAQEFLRAAIRDAARSSGDGRSPG